MKDMFMNLSFPFVMDLYRTRLKAKQRGDTLALENLMRHYPELFSEEFEDFVHEVEQLAESQLQGQTPGVNFSNILANPVQRH